MAIYIPSDKSIETVSRLIKNEWYELDPDSFTDQFRLMDLLQTVSDYNLHDLWQELFNELPTFLRNEYLAKVYNTPL